MTLAIEHALINQVLVWHKKSFIPLPLNFREAINASLTLQVFLLIPSGYIHFLANRLYDAFLVMYIVNQILCLGHNRDTHSK